MLSALIKQCYINYNCVCYTSGVIFGLVLVVLTPEAAAAAADLAHAKLHEKLFMDVWEGYNTMVRPVCGPYPGTLQLNFSVSLQQVFEISEIKQLMTSSLWIHMVWKDCRLKWKESDYGGVFRVVVPSTALWLPDLTLYQNSESKLGEIDEWRAWVTKDGEVKFVVPMIVTTFCRLNVRHFPFDEQHCHLRFGSWAYNWQEINFTATRHPDDETYFVESGEWKVLNTEQYGVNNLYENVDFSEVVFICHLKRRYEFYLIILIVPSVLLLSLSIAGFLLPPETGEKISLEITVLLSLTVFQLVILETMPSTSDNIPVIANYIVLSMFLVALSCTATVVVLRFHFAAHYIGVPYSVRIIMYSWVGRFYGVDKLMEAAHLKTITVHSVTSGQPVNSDHLSMNDSPKQVLGSPRHDEDMFFKKGTATDSVKTDSIQMKRMYRMARKILTCLEKIREFKEKKHQEEVFGQEWRIVAIFLDRIFLTFFMIYGASLMLLLCFKV